MAPKAPRSEEEKLWVTLHAWADSTTKEWTQQAKAEVRRQHRCENMARLRTLRKQELAQIRSERERLEAQVKNYIAAMNSESLSTRTSAQDAPGAKLRHTVHGLVIESDSLRTEKMELIGKLRQRQHFQSIVQDAGLDGVPTADDDAHPHSVHTASEMSPWASSSSRCEGGWRVKFPNGEPSFHFHPFSRAEYDAVMKRIDDEFDARPPPIPVAGQLFGWTVYQAPLARRQEDGAVTGRARLSTRICCSIDQVDAVITPADLAEWPLFVTPPDWSPKLRPSVCIKVLQSLAKDQHVMVCNIPGSVHMRYFQLARREKKLEANGERSLTFSIILADSEGNMRSRVAEGPQPDVKWVGDGGAFLKFTEVSETSVDVKCDSWAFCENETHARHFFIRWVEFACRWSQGITASKLLQYEC
ncbi:hypothetical protein PRNP1_004722 [Phytophthora ramorum]